MVMLVALVAFVVSFGPLLALAALLTRRQAQREAEVARQIALTDALHARLGALLAPVVRGRAGAWRVAVAVPFERPEVVATLLAAADEVLGRSQYDVVLSRQAPAVARSRDVRPPALRKESLSWT
jgi:hypothetical protein